MSNIMDPRHPLRRLVTPRNLILTGAGLFVLGNQAAGVIADNFGHEAVVPVLVFGAGATAVTVWATRTGLRHVRENGLPDLQATWEWFNGRAHQRPQQPAIITQTSPQRGGEIAKDWRRVAAGYKRRLPVLPIGFTAERPYLYEVDFRHDPHWLISGMTGEGKTRFLLRPMAAVAALTGWQVIILDKSGRHFKPLTTHPNIHVVTFEDDTLWPVIHSIAKEAERRERWLAENNATVLEGARADRRPPRTLIIIDEFSNVLTDLRQLGDKEAKQQADAIEAMTTRFVQTFRSIGMHLALVAQRPTHDQLSTTLRGQTMPVTFYLRDDREYHTVGVTKPDPARFPNGLPEGMMIASPRRREAAINAWQPTDADIEAVLRADYPHSLDPSAEWQMHDCGWLHGWRENRIVTTVTAVTGDGDAGTNRESSREEGENQAVTEAETAVVTTRPPAPVTTYQNGHGHAVDSASPAPSGAVVALMEQMLADERPSAVEKLSIGQVNAILLWNATQARNGISQNEMFTAVFGYKNQRVYEQYQQVMLLYSNVVDPDFAINED